MKHLTIRFTQLLSIVIITTLLQGCDNNDPVKEDVPETINVATLEFTSLDGSSIIAATAYDPDGDGPQDRRVAGPIELVQNTSYALKIQLANDLVSPLIDISAEVAAEGDEHMFFFGWSNNLFSNPLGDGNIDSRAGAVNYAGENAMDENGLPLGLTTQWTTGVVTNSGAFRVMLKHQPGLKTSGSGADVGETDLDVTFVINVQ